MELKQRLRRARLAAGVTQHQLAQASGIAQSSIAAYESGARVPSEDSCRRVLTTTGVRPSALFNQTRTGVLELLSGRGITDVRVFGSVARDDEGSDLDLLVSVPKGTSLFDLAEIVDEVEALVGVDVDIVSA